MRRNSSVSTGARSACTSVSRDGNGLGVVLGCGQLQQLGAVAEGTLRLSIVLTIAFQRGALAPELLRALGVVPDAGLAQFEFYFLQAVLADIEVKDTP